VIKSEVVLAVKRRKARLIVVNSRNIHLNKFSALNLRVKPGGEVALVNGMMSVILREGLADAEFLQSRAVGAEALKQALQSLSPEQAEARTGVGGETIAEAARLYAKAKRGVILISTGQNSDDQDPALARAAADLALLAGKIGKESCGVFVLGEKNNSQGALDMGVTPNLLPGYADGKDPGERARFEKAWGLPLPDQPGRGALAILQGIEEGRIKGLYLAGENPVVTYPDSAGRRKPSPPWTSWWLRTVSSPRPLPWPTWSFRPPPLPRRKGLLPTWTAGSNGSGRLCPRRGRPVPTSGSSRISAGRWGPLGAGIGPGGE